MKKLVMLGVLSLSVILGGCVTLDTVNDVVNVVDTVRDTEYRFKEGRRWRKMVKSGFDCYGSGDSANCQRYQKYRRAYEMTLKRRHKYDTVESCYQKRGSYAECRRNAGL